MADLGSGYSAVEHDDHTDILFHDDLIGRVEPRFEDTSVSSSNGEHLMYGESRTYAAIPLRGNEATGLASKAKAIRALLAEHMRVSQHGRLPIVESRSEATRKGLKKPRY